MRRAVLLITGGIAAIGLIMLVGLTLLTLAESLKVVVGFGGGCVQMRLYRGSLITVIEQTPTGVAYDPVSGWDSAQQADGEIADNVTNASTRQALIVGDYARGMRPPGVRFTSLRLVAWVPALPLFLLVWGGARQLSVWSGRRNSSACPVCGYDLRESDRQCSECGWHMPYEVALRLAFTREARAVSSAPADQTSILGLSWSRKSSRR